MARIARIAGGSLLVLAGIIMLVIPGPGLLTIAAGIIMLAKDVPAAERFVAWARDKMTRRDASEATPDEAELS